VPIRPHKAENIRYEVVSSSVDVEDDWELLWICKKCLRLQGILYIQQDRKFWGFASLAHYLSVYRHNCKSKLSSCNYVRPFNFSWWLEFYLNWCSQRSI
jgi:hypothetical protein